MNMNLGNLQIYRNGNRRPSTAITRRQYIKIAQKAYFSKSISKFTSLMYIFRHVQLV